MSRNNINIQFQTNKHVRPKCERETCTCEKRPIKNLEDGSSYEGEWCGDKFNGEGILI